MRIFFEKKFIVAFFFGLASAMAFCAGTKRVSATKNRNCNQIVIVNESSEMVRIAQSDGVNVTGWIESGRRSSLNVNSIVLEIGSNCSASTSVSGRNFIVTVRGGGSSSSSSSSGSPNSPATHCIQCHGSGKCPKCNGKGWVYYSHKYYSDHGKEKCSRCGGDGQCPYCNGTGRK